MTAFFGIVDACRAKSGETAGLSRLVDPMIGTDGHGHTFPGATMPFGLVQLSPDQRTSGWDWCSGYHYSSPIIMGFSHTHLSGTGVGDYGDILFMPTVGAIRLESGAEKNPEEGYRSLFSHSSERAEPGFYSVRLESFGVEAELTATPRCGIHRYTFPESDEANVIIDLKHGISNTCTGGRIEIAGANRVEGMRRSRGWADDRFVYFAAEFSKPFNAFGTSSGGAVSPGARKAEGDSAKGYVTFSTEKGEAITVKVGISAVSPEGARRNLAAEAPGFDFDSHRRAAREAWNAELSRMRIEGGTEARKRTFYTALYHALIAPNVFQDIDGKYFGMDHKIHEAAGFTNYTVFSLWDTFRALHPLITIIDPERAQDFVRTLIQAYRECGLLPVWTLWGNETYTMIGYHSVPVIFDAWMKGLRDFDAGTAYEAMKHSAENNIEGLDWYRRLGFIPADKDDGAVSKILEYSYDDWCLAQMAKAIGKEADYEYFNQRSLFYRHVFDPVSGFMRGRMYDGRWIEPFDPFAVSGQYTEANAWQYSFFVPHDPAGLMKLYGGQDKLEAKLDALFSAPSALAGREQPDVTGMIGQNAHGNEPSHHVPYLYVHAGCPWKTQNVVREIMDRLYSAKKDGLAGNEDCGQMSAWYVLSALGFYPVTPGQNVYAIGSPLFQRAVIDLGSGKKFVIEAENDPGKNRFIKSATLDGRPFDRSYIRHEEIMRGGILKFMMSGQPVESRVTDASGLFEMAPDDDLVPVPMIESTGEVFYERAAAKITTPEPEAVIRFTIDGSDPGPGSPVYEKPVEMTKAGVLKAAAFLGDRRSMTVNYSFIKSKYPPAAYTHPFAAHHNGGGAMALTDGREGTIDYRSGFWQGFEGVDLEAVIDLTGMKKINRVSAGFLQNVRSWIFFPRRVEFSVSTDGKNFRQVSALDYQIDPRLESRAIKKFEADLAGVEARYLKVFAKNVGVCPSWHPGAGGRTWIFADEVSIDSHGSDSVIDKAGYARAVKEEFRHAWDNYKLYAWGHDEFKPLSRSAHDWYEKPLLMTPVDSLDSLILLGFADEAAEAKRLILDKLSFDKNIFVSNFEITIRLLGGLLSAYELDGDPGFLRLAVDLADRLLPAFDSPTGMPYRFVNLKTGEKKGKVSNPAEIGTLTLEFGTLSRLTGNPLYYDKVKKAVTYLFGRRSPLGLVGTSIDVETGAWTDRRSHISGAIDSYYEYLLKAAIMFEDAEFMKMWKDGVAAVNEYLADDKEGELWYGLADMNTGRIERTMFGSLDAFFPAVLALAGDLDRARRLQGSCYKLWFHHGIEPERIDYSDMSLVSPGYYLRPENIESNYYLYKLTGDELYLLRAVTYLDTLKQNCRVEAGYASLKNVVSGEKLDEMPSYFLSETLKYLYLTFAPDNIIDIGKTIFTTEAHPLKKSR